MSLISRTTFHGDRVAEGTELLRRECTGRYMRRMLECLLTLGVQCRSCITRDVPIDMSQQKVFSVEKGLLFPSKDGKCDRWSAQDIHLLTARTRSVGEDTITDHSTYVKSLKKIGETRVACHTTRVLHGHEILSQKCRNFHNWVLQNQFLSLETGATTTDDTCATVPHAVYTSTGIFLPGLL